VPTKKEHNDEQTITFRDLEVLFQSQEVLGLNLGEET